MVISQKKTSGWPEWKLIPVVEDVEQLECSSSAGGGRIDTTVLEDGLAVSSKARCVHSL